MKVTMAAAALLVCVSAAAQEGPALFDAYGCAACHRIGARGGSSGPDLTLAGFRRSKDWLDAWLLSPRAWKPGTDMPEQGISTADRRALVEYLSAQTGGAWREARPWSALTGRDRGRAIYLRAGCVACHGSAGTGGHPNPHARGGVIPALAPLISTYNRSELLAKIQNGVVTEAVSKGGPLVVMPAWRGVLTTEEMDSLVDYLLTLGVAQSRTEW